MFTTAHYMLRKGISFVTQASTMRDPYLALQPLLCWTYLRIKYKDWVMGPNRQVISPCKFWMCEWECNDCRMDVVIRCPVGL